VQFLFGKPLLREEAVAFIRQDRTITEPLRKAALIVAEHWPEDLAALDNASWAIVRSAGAPAERYALALRYAEAASRLNPDYGGYLTTLGVAQYRVGCYQETLTTLTRSGQIHSKAKEFHSADLAFLAMAQHRLGQKAQARATFSRLTEAMKDPAFARDEAAQGFLREAEALLQEKRAP
jgi:tetratricopeptide (TPR) repeat protein